MTKLTDIQLILLTTASQRDDGSLLPPPDGIGASAKRIRTSVAALLKQDLAEEVEIRSEAQCWRKDEDRSIGLRITDAGRNAIGRGPTNGGSAVDPTQGDLVPPSDAAPTPAPIARVGTKQALLIDLLKRDSGASITELAEATRWLPHTTRAALTALRKRGFTIVSEKDAGVSRYRLTEQAQS